MRTYDNEKRFSQFERIHVKSQDHAYMQYIRNQSQGLKYLMLLEERLATGSPEAPEAASWRGPTRRRREVHHGDYTIPNCPHRVMK